MTVCTTALPALFTTTSYGRAAKLTGYRAPASSRPENKTYKVYAFVEPRPQMWQLSRRAPLGGGRWYSSLHPPLSLPP